MSTTRRDTSIQSDSLFIGSGTILRTYPPTGGGRRKPEHECENHARRSPGPGAGRVRGRYSHGRFGRCIGLHRQCVHRGRRLHEEADRIGEHAAGDTAERREIIGPYGGAGVDKRQEPGRRDRSGREGMDRPAMAAAQGVGGEDLPERIRHDRQRNILLHLPGRCDHGSQHPGHNILVAELRAHGDRLFLHQVRGGLRSELLCHIPSHKGAEGERVLDLRYRLQPGLGVQGRLPEVWSAARHEQRGQGEHRGPRLHRVAEQLPGAHRRAHVRRHEHRGLEVLEPVLLERFQVGLQPDHGALRPRSHSVLRIDKADHDQGRGVDRPGGEPFQRADIQDEQRMHREVRRRRR